MMRKKTSKTLYHCNVTRCISFQFAALILGTFRSVSPSAAALFIASNIFFHSVRVLFLFRRAISFRATHTDVSYVSFAEHLPPSLWSFGRRSRSSSHSTHKYPLKSASRAAKDQSVRGPFDMENILLNLYVG